MDELIERIQDELTVSSIYERRLNQFHDEDLRMYPAVSIKRTSFSVDEYETIANNLIDQISSGKSMAEAARGLVALAYNTLMDNNSPAVESIEDNLFFRKYDSMMTEDWLNISGESDLDLGSFLDRPASGRTKKLRLLAPEAGNYQRMAAIGSWAFSHLRAMCKTMMASLFDYFKEEEIFNRSFKFAYGVNNPYRIPVFSWEIFRYLSNEIAWHRPGEVMFLLYKSMIMLEKIRNQRDFDPQERLLEGLVFGPQCCLRDHGFELYSKSISAAKLLEIPIEELFDKILEALRKPPLGEFAARDIEALEYLSQFHDWQSKQATQYYRYARLINHHYFYCLDQKQNQVLVSALTEIFNLRNPERKNVDSRTDEPWRRWGQEIAYIVCEIMPIRQKVSMYFRDSDLSAYPALEIAELDLSADDCEHTANRIIETITLGQDQCFSKATNAMCALAYNVVMHSTRSPFRFSQKQKTFYQTHRLQDYNESWFQISGQSKFNLREFMDQESSIDRDETRSRLELIGHGASDFERKASIGAWALYHLRLFKKVNGSVWPQRITHDFNGRFTEVYGFDNCYRFPTLSGSNNHKLNDEFMKRSGEVLFLFFRSIIIFERSQWQALRDPTSKLLWQLALGRPNSLRGFGLGLYTWIDSVRVILRISERELLDSLDEALESLPASPNVDREIQALAHLRRFLRWRSLKTSRYYDYSRLFSELYYSNIYKEHYLILLTCLVELYNQRNNKKRHAEIQADKRSRECGLEMARQISARFPRNRETYCDSWRSRPNYF